MPRRVDFVEDAAASLQDACTWLHQPGSGQRGHKRWLAIRAVLRTLTGYPCGGRLSAEYPGRRNVNVSGYRVFYRLLPDTGDRRTAGAVLVVILGPGQP